MRCCAHILNLIVQNGLKQIDPIIVKICISIKSFKFFGPRKQKNLECIKLVSLASKRRLYQYGLHRTRPNPLTPMNSAENWVEFATRTGLKFITTGNDAGPKWAGLVQGQGHNDPNWPDPNRSISFFFNTKI